MLCWYRSVACISRVSTAWYACTWRVVTREMLVLTRFSAWGACISRVVHASHALYMLLTRCTCISRVDSASDAYLKCTSRVLFLFLVIVGKHIWYLHFVANFVWQLRKAPRVGGVCNFNDCFVNQYLLFTSCHTCHQGRGMVYGKVQHGMVYGMIIWHDMVWHDMVWE